MCGIAGIIASRPLTPQEGICVREMTRRLAHRGPDGEGFFTDDFAALGHRRLAIVDLTGGQQPVSDEAGLIHAVVNGEFYGFSELRNRLNQRGHRLKSQGDSECLIHLYEDYGPECFRHVNGMFAAAIWDSRSKTALLARDRLGVKPLYYHFDGSRLAFASEMKSILAATHVPREIDLSALHDYLTFGFIPSPKTVYKGIQKLPPATMLVLHENHLRLESYWDLHYHGWAECDAVQVQSDLWNSLLDATARRLVCDVPIGAFLSGGIDSTAVVAAMAEAHGSSVTTMTCGFEDDGFDEREFARHAATRLATDHHEIQAAAELDTIIDRLAHHFDEPFADASAIPTFVLSQEARRHVTVALSGDGGDEVLAGYRRYRFDRAEERVRRMIPALVRTEALGRLGPRWPTARWMPKMLRAGATLQNISVDGASGHGQSIATLSLGAARELLSGDVAGVLSDYDPLDHIRQLYHRCDAPDHLSKCQYVDIRCGLADGILVKVDRSSMAHGLEVRSPMLDYRFVEQAWSIPPALRMKGGQGKYLLRRIVAEKVDAELGRRGKRGFETPIDRWLVSHWRERVTAVVHDSPIEEWINLSAVERLWREHQSGRRLHGPTLWKILMLDAWARAHHTATPGSLVDRIVSCIQ